MRASVFLALPSNSFTLSLLHCFFGGVYSHGQWHGRVSVVSAAAAPGLGALWGYARQLDSRRLSGHQRWCTDVPKRLQQHRRGGVIQQRLCQLELQHQHHGPQLQAAGRTSPVVLSLEGDMISLTLVYRNWPRLDQSKPALAEPCLIWISLLFISLPNEMLSFIST